MVSKSEPSLCMSDLQWYPVFLYLTNNVENIVVFPAEKVFKSHAFSVVHEARKSKSSAKKPWIKIINFQNLKYGYLIKSCESDMPVNHTI